MLTLLVSHLSFQVASYPFTTLVPNLGVVRVRDFSSLVFADVPGLLEGASQGVGLGREFLRHTMRCSVLVRGCRGMPHHALLRAGEWVQRDATPCAAPCW